MSGGTPAELRRVVNAIAAALLRVSPDKRLVELKRQVAAITDADHRWAVETMVLATEDIMTQASNRSDKIGLLCFAAGTLVIMLALALFVPMPTPFQLLVFRVCLSLGAGGAAWFIPGTLNVSFKYRSFAVRATGALAFAAIVYLVNPPALYVSPPGP